MNKTFSSYKSIILKTFTLISVIIYTSFAFSLFAASKMQKETEYKYKINVGQFNKLRITDNVNVVYRNVPDSTGYVIYHGIDDFADSFIFTVTNGTMRVQVITEDVDKPNLPTLYIYSDFLTEVENASSFSLTIESIAPCADFKAMQVGNGSINIKNIKANKVTTALATGKGSIIVSGECDCENIRLIGVGTIQADQLKANQVNIKTAGSGSVGCWAIDKLKIGGLGSTKIYYKGAPKIKKTGTAKLYHLPEN